MKKAQFQKQNYKIQFIKNQSIKIKKINLIILLVNKSFLINKNMNKFKKNHKADKNFLEIFLQLTLKAK